MNTGVDHRHLYSAVRIAAKHRLDGGGQPSVILGTGFIVALEGSKRFLIVSNRHILDKTWLEPLWNNSVLELEIDVWENRQSKLTWKIFPEKVYCHDDETVDVAAIPINRIASDVRPKSAVLDSALPWAFLTEAQKNWDLLEPSETVFSSGYPEWHDRNGGRPIMRTGAIVSDPRFDYRYKDGLASKEDGNRQILFEAFSSSGNSGSPVFVAQRGLPSSNQIR